MSLGIVVTQLFFSFSHLGYHNNNLGQYYNFLLSYDFIDFNMSCHIIICDIRLVEFIYFLNNYMVKFIKSLL